MSTHAIPELADATGATTLRTMERSFHRALSGGGVAWQLFMVLAALSAPTRFPVAILVTAHLILALAAAVTLWRSASAVPLVLGIYLVGFVDLAAAAGPGGILTFGAMWSLGVVAASPVFIMGRWRAAALGACVLGLAVIELGLIHPDWPPYVAAFTITTSVVLMVAAQILMSWLRSVTRRADDTTARAQQIRHQARIAELAGLEIDEDARLLHDTLINTLGAVASGRGATRNPEAVRDRCARDAAVVAGLMAHDGHVAAMDARLSGLDAVEPGIAVLLEIPSEAVLDRFEEMMPAATRRALVGATQEAIRNAAKHSGADRVTVTVALSGPDIEVRVRDEGVGFEVIDAVDVQRGMAHSIQRRCEDAGIDVVIDSEPGAGATIVLAWSMVETPSADALSPDEQPHVRSVAAEVDAVTRAVSWSWAVFVLASALVTTRVSPPVPGHWTDWAIALVAALCLGSWTLSRHGRSLPGWAAVVIAVAVPVAFSLSFTGVHLGAIPLVTMQSLVVTPLMVILILRVTSRGPLLIGLAGLALVVTGFSVATAGEDPERVLDPLIAAGPLVALGGSWLAFVPMLTRIATQRAASRQDVFEAETAMAVGQAVRKARTRWVNAGIKEGADIVRALGEGELDPLDPQVQRRCGEIEQHIRSLLAIDNDLVHLGPWLAAALLRARSRTVSVSIVGGAVDAPDAPAAEELGRMLLAVLSLCQRGSRVVVGIFGGPEDPVFSLVGPADLAERVSVIDGVRWRVTASLHDDHWRAEARLR